MAEPEMFDHPLPRETVRRLADETFGDMVKFVVDIRREMICAGGGLHSDEEALLLESGSAQEDLWGANYYPDLSSEERFEYTSVINIRPAANNRGQEIASDEIRRKVRALAVRFFEPPS
jgi:hypothetical protein